MKISVLDQSPATLGKSQHLAIQESLALAGHCDRLGYHRYWVSEHHNSDSIVGTAPEILMAAIAATTTRIRVGSAGVMLPHYSALKVAEQLLAAHLGLPYAYAYFFTEGRGTEQALELYRRLYRPSERYPVPHATICVWALAAQTEGDARLQDLAARFALDEIVINTWTHDPLARHRSYELLANEFGLARGNPRSEAQRTMFPTDDGLRRLNPTYSTGM